MSKIFQETKSEPHKEQNRMFSYALTHGLENVTNAGVPSGAISSLVLSSDDVDVAPAVSSRKTTPV